ncbi:MAG: glutathione transferase GstA [Pseudomonas sp.]
MKLYYSPGACSLSPHIVLREAGFNFDLEKADLQTKKTEKGADFRGVNPNGYVPVVVLDDGQHLTEGLAIVLYLADRVPEKKLAAAHGTTERYRLIEWLNFISTELHKGFAPLFNPKAPEEWKTIVTELLSARLTYVSEKLGQQPYVMGNSFTVADAYLFTVLSWGKWVGVDIGRWPVLVTYSERVAARPAVQAALKAEGLI